MAEQRQEPRVTCVLDATWDGQSGAQSCRVTDVSWHGCFVQSMCAPVVGSQALITLTLGDDRIRLRGAVRYVEPRMGFAVMFGTISSAQAKVLVQLLGEPAVALALS